MVEFQRAANMVANIIRKGNEPYYDASRDDKTAIARTGNTIDELVTAENTFNSLVTQRNTAWVAEAKCLIELGKIDEGITRLMRALDSISGTSEAALWQEARTLLWAQVGLEMK